MYKYLLNIICCPICKGNLNIEIEKEEEISIISGKLKCTKCNKEYIIKDGIPDMLSHKVTTYYKKDYK